MRSTRTIRQDTRWTPEEWDCVEEAARAHRMPPLRYVREAALVAARERNAMASSSPVRRRSSRERTDAADLVRCDVLEIDLPADVVVPAWRSHDPARERSWRSEVRHGGFLVRRRAQTCWCGNRTKCVLLDAFPPPPEFAGTRRQSSRLRRAAARLLSALARVFR